MGWKWKKLSAQFCQSLEVTNSPNNLQTPKQPWIILRPIHFKCYQYSYFLYKSCYDGLLLHALSYVLQICKCATVHAINNDRKSSDT